MTKQLHAALLTCAFSTLSACATGSDTPVELRSLHQGFYCGDEQPGMRWLTPADFAQVLGNANAGQHLGAAPAAAPEIAKHEKLLLVSLGQKNSGGYSVSLTEQQAQINDGTVQLPLKIQQPAPGTMQTMQITNPCLVIALGGEGYSKVSGGDLGVVTVGR